MSTFKKQILIIFVLLFSKFSIAQDQTKYIKLPCAIDEIHKSLLKSDPLYKKNVSEIENRIQLFIRDSITGKQNRQNNSVQKALVVYTIPVVVHVIHVGETVGQGTNIPDAQITQAIAGLNDRFRNFIGSGLDVEIQFCLAARDPNGNSTTGVNRVNGSGVANYYTYGIEGLGCGIGASETAIKNLSRWPNTDYYNIWIVRSICNGAWGGYAYYPGASSSVDGAVIVYNQFGYNDYTTAHELGHGFNLYHTFNGDNNNTACPANTNCTTQGDLCCDTPPHKQGDCGATNPCTTSGIWDNSHYNYMSYCWPGNSFGRFTQDQTNRMRATLNVSPRSNLLNSLGCVAPPAFTFDSPAPVSSSCPAPATMAITLGTNTNSGFSNPISLSAIAGVPAGTNVTFGTNPVVPGNSSVVTLNNTNTLSIGTYVITIQGVASGASNQTRDLIFAINPGTGPPITVQPVSQTICIGANTNFNITSPTATRFQWQLSTNGGTSYNNFSNGGVYSGVTTASLSITGTTAEMDNYRYRCIASHSCGSTTSGTGILSFSPNVNAGTVSGITPLCLGATTTYASNGTSGGSWSSSVPSVASVNSSSGFVTAIAAGTTSITYSVNTGCGSPVSSFKILTVDPTISTGTVSGTSPLCIGETATYGSDGTAGGTWSSTNTAVATVNVTTGLVTAVNAGTTNIMYTLVSCSISSFQTLTVSPNVTSGTISGTSPLFISQTATYTSTGTSGGTWSSTVPTVASVNSSTGFVTALSIGTTDITYTVNAGCGSPVSNFKTLTITPVNDDAPGAILLTVDAGCTGSPYTNAGATQSGSEPFAACQGTTGFKTVWYKFTAPASGAVKISNDYSGGTMGIDSRLALFSSTNVNDYSTFTNIACNDDNGVNVAGRSILYATGLTPGNTYYIQVDCKDGSTSAGTFCLTVDDLTSSMISTSTACTAGQNLNFVNDNYTGWLSATDMSGKLVALISNPSGGATTSTSTYTHNLNINSGAVRTDAISGQKYLDRNFSINNSSVSNANVRFFILNTELTALQAADPGVTLAQLQVTRQTGTTCDNDFIVDNGSNSSLVQTANGSASGFSWVQVTTPGFSKFYIYRPAVRMPVKVFLQGAFNPALARHKNITSLWVTAMNSGTGGNALSQPYNVAPFSYTGTESKTSFPPTTSTGTDILDWVLLELRQGASPTAVISRRAAFVLCNGNVVDTDGVSPVRFNNVPTGNYHVVVRHRNHLAIRTSATTNMDAALGAAAPALYDFTIAQAKAFQVVPSPTGNAAMKDTLVSAVHYLLMWGGNANGITTAGAPAIRATGPGPINDYSFLTSPAVLPTIASVVPNKYHPADMNMDATIRATGPGPINDYSFLINTVLISLSTIITQHQ